MCGNKSRPHRRIWITSFWEGGGSSTFWTTPSSHFILEWPLAMQGRCTRSPEYCNTRSLCMWCDTEHLGAQCSQMHIKCRALHHKSQHRHPSQLCSFCLHVYHICNFFYGQICCIQSLTLALHFNLCQILKWENKAIYPLWKDAMLYGFQNFSIFYVNIAAACARNWQIWYLLLVICIIFLKLCPTYRKKLLRKWHENGMMYMLMCLWCGRVQWEPWSIPYTGKNDTSEYTVVLERVQNSVAALFLFLLFILTSDSVLISYAMHHTICSASYASCSASETNKDVVDHQKYQAHHSPHHNQHHPQGVRERWLVLVASARWMPAAEEH